MFSRSKQFKLFSALKKNEECFFNGVWFDGQKKKTHPDQQQENKPIFIRRNKFKYVVRLNRKDKHEDMHLYKHHERRKKMDIGCIDT